MPWQHDEFRLKIILLSICLTNRSIRVGAAKGKARLFNSNQKEKKELQPNEKYLGVRCEVGSAIALEPVETLEGVRH